MRGQRGGVNKPSLVGGGLPRKFAKFGCFLLQSGHSSALFPGLLITSSYARFHPAGETLLVQAPKAHVLPWAVCIMKRDRCRLTSPRDVTSPHWLKV